jgi:hypothetical protein
MGFKLRCCFQIKNALFGINKNTIKFEINAVIFEMIIDQLINGYRVCGHVFVEYLKKS